MVHERLTVTDGPERERGHYTSAFRASALALLTANDGNVSETARQLGITRQVLTQWRDSHADAAFATIPTSDLEAHGRTWLDASAHALTVLMTQLDRYAAIDKPPSSNDLQRIASIFDTIAQRAADALRPNPIHAPNRSRTITPIVRNTPALRSSNTDPSQD